MTRLESLILASAAEPSLLFVPRTLKDLSALPLAQRFNFDIVKTAWVVRDALERVCSSAVPGQEARMPAFVGDSLLPWITKLDTIIGRVVNPLVAEIKREAATTISRARLQNMERVPSGNTLQAAASVMAAKPAFHLSAESLMIVGSTAPTYLQELAALLESSKKLFTDVLGCGKEADRWIVSCATHVTWKGMLSFAARPCPVDCDEDHLSNSHSSMSSASPHAPHPQPVRSKSALPLLRNGTKRSPSPPAGKHANVKDGLLKLIDELAIFRALVISFTSGVLSHPIAPSLGHAEALKKAETVQELCTVFDLLPELDAEEEGMSLTEEAMHEALLAISSFELVVRALKWPAELKLAFLYDDEDSSSSESSNPTQRLTPSTVFNLSGPCSPASRIAVEKQHTRPQPRIIEPIKLPSQDIVRALDTLPPLITFHLLASRMPLHRNHPFQLPHEVWNLSSWDEYAASLTGFSTGESFAEEVGWQMIKELDRLKKEVDEPEGVFEDLLRCAVAAECGL